MKFIRVISILFWFLLVILIPVQPVIGQSMSSAVITISVQGPLTPALVGYIERGISSAEKQNAELLVLQLDTPGGSIDLMNTIVQNIRSSEIPVAVFVAPRGAIAGKLQGKSDETPLGSRDDVITFLRETPGAESLTGKEIAEITGASEATVSRARRAFSSNGHAEN